MNCNEDNLSFKLEKFPNNGGQNETKNKNKILRNRTLSNNLQKYFKRHHSFFFLPIGPKHPRMLDNEATRFKIHPLPSIFLPPY